MKKLLSVCMRLMIIGFVALSAQGTLRTGPRIGEVTSTAEAVLSDKLSLFTSSPTPFFWNPFDFCERQSDQYVIPTRLGDSVGIRASIAVADSTDREDDVDAVRTDVYVLVAGRLQNPVGFCTQVPCSPGETLPNEQLFNINGTALGLTWGQFQAVNASSRVSCRRDGTTDVRIRLTGLIPNGVYSIFYRQFGPDSVNPFCPNEERSRVVPNLCRGPGCESVAPDSRVVADENGEANFVGRVNGCLLDSTTLLFDVIYHSNGTTYGELPNQLEFQTQLRPCQSGGDCDSGDICLANVCQPSSCGADPPTSCRVCHSSFGRDAFRQAVIVQEAP